MVEFSIAGTRIKISFLFVCLLSLLSLWDKSGGIFLSVLFSLLHEAGHISAILLCRERIDELSFLPHGIAMKLSKTATFTTCQELFVLISGCLVNFIFILLSKGTVQYINLGIFLFNILPIGSLDGGRLISLIFTRLFGGRKGERLALLTSFLILLPLSALAFYMTISARQPSLFICCVYLSLTLLIKREKLF